MRADKLAWGLRGALLASVAFAAPAMAQDAEQPAPETIGNEEIVVTATKREGETVQSAPLAITAFSADQLAGQQFRNLESLAYSAPNVQLSPGGAVPGTANFTIRGLGIASTIPSIDPTVGIFVDGVYQGITIGSVFDTFDLEGVEVLRGPQGLLFGKNVTGGAVLLRTTTPSNETIVDSRLSYETGPRITAQSVVSGPLIADVLQAKVAAYYDYDEGWFENQLNGDDLGGGRTWLVRGALRFTPGDVFEVIARYEHGQDSRFDGPVNQNRARFAADSFLLEQSPDPANTTDYFGSDANWDSITVEANLDVGAGTITSVTGYRDLEIYAGFDSDGLRQHFFHAFGVTEQDQFSQELRFAGSFGNFDVTVGGYYFTQNLLYIEDRSIGNGVTQVVRLTGGGTQDSETLGFFANIDWHITDTLTLNVGGRYTTEDKSVSIGRIRPGGCDAVALVCAPDFVDDVNFDGFTPRVGLQWEPNNDFQVYGFWTEGFRSGGYNLRNTGVGIPPGPFDDERQTAFEAGFKADFLEDRVRLNTALFYTEMNGLQREIILPDPVAGIVQVIQNTADARIMGLEVEANVRVVDGLSLFGTLGITDGDYTEVTADLNRDGAINQADEDLKIPRLAPITYSFGANLNQPIEGFGTIEGRVSYAFRDDSFYTDSNALGTTLARSNILDASLGVAFNDQFTLTVYGRNLLDDVTQNTNAQLPPTFGGPGASLTLLNRGRVWGVSGRYRF